MVVSGDGFVLKVPSASRSASTRAPVRSRRCASRMLRPGDRRARRHDDLFQPELQVPIVHHDVEELGHVRLEHERRDAHSADALRVDDAVGAGTPELLLAFLDPRSRRR